MTQVQRIISHINTGAYISPLSALVNLGVARLAARVYDINQAIFLVYGDSADLQVEMHTTPLGVRYATYRLPKRVHRLPLDLMDRAARVLAAGDPRGR